MVVKRNILEFLEATAERVPERVAFYDDASSLTYARLLHAAQAIGSALAERVKPRGVAALVMDGHSLLCVQAMLGVLYAGCAYAPLDPAMPAERLTRTLHQMQPACVITDEVSSRALQAAADSCPLVLRAEQLAEAPVRTETLRAIRAQATLRDPLSILYTSGSTGVPKGSVQSHSSYIHYTEATIEVYGFDEDAVFGSQSPFFYANSIIDLYPPMALGARVYLLPRQGLAFPRHFLSALRRERVTELTMTPSSFIALVDALEEDSLPDLRYAIMSGEKMAYPPLRRWLRAAPNADFYHFYGSTEAFSVAVGRVKAEHAGNGMLPVGPPFRQVKLLFVDEEGRRQSAHEGGEMLVASPWVCGGYYRDEERTRAAFCQIPPGQDEAERFYRTGDIGRINGGGELLVLGRRDAQVKHHGYRMELGEVEAALRSLPGLMDGCVLYDEAEDVLCCFWTGDVPEKELRAGLRAQLPRAMMPDRYVHLAQLPHTATMKVDKSALRAMID